MHPAVSKNAWEGAYQTQKALKSLPGPASGLWHQSACETLCQSQGACTLVMQLRVMQQTWRLPLVMHKASRQRWQVQQHEPSSQSHPAMSCNGILSLSNSNIVKCHAFGAARWCKGSVKKVLPCTTNILYPQAGANEILLLLL